MRSISIVIPNYNGRELLERNLPFVYRALSTSGVTDYEIIIPDDASKDASVEFLRESYPAIQVITHSANKGFGGNSNSGIFKSDKELVLLLNSDVELTDGFFIPLMPYFDNQDTFGVMSRIIRIDSHAVQDGAKYPDYSFGHIGPNLNYRSESQSSLYTLFLSGANALMERKNSSNSAALMKYSIPIMSRMLILVCGLGKLGINATMTTRQCVGIRYRQPLKKRNPRK